MRLYMSQTDQYMASQRTSAAQTALVSKDLRDCLATQMEQFRATQQQQAQALSLAIATQAARMEQSLKALVGDLVTQSQASIAAQTLQLNQYCEATTSSRESEFEKLDALLSKQANDLEDTFTQLSQHVQSGVQLQVSQCDEASRARSLADASLRNVSGSVLTQKHRLEETVSNVVDHVKAAVLSGCAVIQSTSATANKVVTDVTNASENMSGKATESMDEFKAFLEDTGAKLSAELSTHFQDLDSHLATQDESLARVDDQLGSFGQTMLSTQVVATGATPKKQRFAPLPVLASTRSHEEIKSEVREAASHAQSTDEHLTSAAVGDEKVDSDLQSPFEDIENLSPGAANIVPVDLRSTAGKELLSKSKAAKVTRTSKSSQDSDTASVSSTGALRARSRVVS